MKIMTVEDVLTRHGVPYVLHAHAAAESLDERAALGFPMARTVKTLAFRDRRDGRVLLAALLTGDRLDYRAFAVAAETSRSALERLPARELGERLGAGAGGVAPLPVADAVGVLLDARPAALSDSMFTGAGRPDRTLELRPADLLALPGVGAAPIAAIADSANTLP